MNNLASFDEIKLNNGQLTPCIKVLRGIDIATKQQGARFVLKLSVTYNSEAGGVVVIPPYDLPLKQTTGVESRDPMWAEVVCPSILLPEPPAAGGRFTCSATITITGANGLPTPCSDLDKQILRPS